MVFVVCALLAVGAIGFTLLVRERDIPPVPLENPELKHLETRRQVLYDNLKDLQFEYHQGKLSDQDYQSLKAGFLYDLAGIMDSIERLPRSQEKPGKPGGPAPVREKLKPQKAATDRLVTPCPACGFENPAANRFCGRCGKAMRQ